MREKFGFDLFGDPPEIRTPDTLIKSLAERRTLKKLNSNVLSPVFPFVKAFCDFSSCINVSMQHAIFLCFTVYNAVKIQYKTDSLFINYKAVLCAESNFQNMYFGMSSAY